MKKICFLVSDFSVIGGVERVLSILANALCKTYEVHIVDLEHVGDSIPYALDESIHYACLDIRGSRLREKRKEAKKPLAAYFKKNKIDVALLMGTYVGFIGSPQRFCGRTKLVFCDHGTLMGEWNDGIKKRIMRFMSLVLCHNTVTLTLGNQEDYYDKFKVCKGKIKQIYNPISNQFLENAGEYLPQSKKIISVGRFSAEKRYDIVVEVAKLVLPKYPDWKWDLYGDGVEYDYVSKKIAEYNLGNQLILKGNVNPIYSYYKNYAFLVSTSATEGFGMVYVEAQANCLPVIAFAAAKGPCEIIKDNVNGRLIQKFSIKTMADEIESLIVNKNRRIQYSEHSRDELNKFNIDIIIKQWVDLINSL